MDLQSQMRSVWSGCYEPTVELDLCSQSKSSHGNQEGNSDLNCNTWKDAELARVKSCNGHSFAKEARIRLDHLKSGGGSPSPCCATNKTLYNYNSEKDLWDAEEPQEEKSSALDLVEILDIEEEEVKDEESWLYELPKQQSSVEVKESAQRWCRHVLDNPSPEMEAACHALKHTLDQKSRHPLSRQLAVFRPTPSVSSAQKVSDSSDHSELSLSRDSITTGYKLQDITDVHIMARMQEASLRQDYISTPSTASPTRSLESESMLSSWVHSAAENADDYSRRTKTKSSSSTSWQPAGSASLSSSPCRSPSLSVKAGCQSPRLARLHQQVTQFKLLKLAQNSGASPDRTRSPLRTSLRSLQAVRNSRSLDTEDDCLPADQFTLPPSGATLTRRTPSGWSAPVPPVSVNSNGSLESMREPSARMTAIKRIHRSQSLSPCRIPHSAKGILSAHGRVFASPERPMTAAWSRNLPSSRR